MLDLPAGNKETRKPGAENMIKLYGSSRSRAARCLWMLEEIGKPYEQLTLSDLDPADHIMTVSRVNPIGKVPAMEDGELKLFESMAINLYLAKKYGGALWPEDESTQARAIAWSIWGMTEMEPPLAQLYLERVIRSEDARDRENELRALETVKRPLETLERVLDGKEYLLGDRFNIADLNLASVLTLMTSVKFDLDDSPNTKRWREACYGREAFKRSRPA